MQVERFTILGSPVGLFGLENYEGSHLGQDPTGTSLWMSSLVMCKVLEQRSSSDVLKLGARKVVEIGAGLGLPALMARRLGCADVTVTDRDDAVVSLIEINAAAMYLESPEGEDWDGDVSSIPIRVAAYAYGEVSFHMHMSGRE
jgi:predicted nicotinamide N-methyase